MVTKRRRGRPQGGRHPEPLRQYWREVQRSYRANQAVKVIMNVPKQRRRKK